MKFFGWGAKATFKVSVEHIMLPELGQRFTEDNVGGGKQDSATNNDGGKGQS